MKKVIVVIILIILVIAVAMMAPPITSQITSSPASPAKRGEPAPTPKPTPIVKIDSNSNLPEEAKKLNVSDYQSDYDLLGKALSQF